MNFNPRKELCAQMGLSTNGQIRTPYIYKNLWWVVEGQNSAFGQGDLDTNDVERMLNYLEHPSHPQDMVILCWDEHHGTKWQRTVYPMIRISRVDHITYPNYEAQQAVMNSIRERSEAR